MKSLILPLIALSVLIGSSLYAQPREWAQGPGGTKPNTLIKENDLHTDSASGNCDTLQYPLAGTYTYYLVIGDESGYVSGNNTYLDKAKANYFATFPENSEIRGILFEFAVATHLSGANPSVTFAVWDNSGPQGAPGAIKASTTLPLSQIVQDVSAQAFTYAEFSSPLLISGPFYAGVILPASEGDTVALWTNTNGDVAAGISWEQWSNNSWYAYSESWELRISNAIFPVVCGSSQDVAESSFLKNIELFPNPATTMITVRSDQSMEQEGRISIYNLMGVLLDSKDIASGNVLSATFRLEGYSKGLYFVIIEIGKQKITKKVHVI